MPARCFKIIFLMARFFVLRHHRHNHHHHHRRHQSSCGCVCVCGKCLRVCVCVCVRARARMRVYCFLSRSPQVEHSLMQNRNTQTHMCSAAAKQPSLHDAAIAVKPATQQQRLWLCHHCGHLVITPATTVVNHPSRDCGHSSSVPPTVIVVSPAPAGPAPI